MKEQPECKVYPDGSKEWCLHEKYHREDGPAVEWAGGDKHWYLHGKLHREDGPAVDCADGYKAWYLNDKEVHPEQIVDLQLCRGTFCYYDEQSNELRFE
jgi:hypothetical protein